jgi:CheY-like chemotaxis protein/anti-sigma regulatory factor (Ser/Thr protein kinase)
MARVLVAEDSRTQAQQIRMLLEEASFEVETASHGVEALACMRRVAPDIVLTDLEMPQMNGLELVEAVRKEFGCVPVVLMTAHGSEEIAALALSKGAASYIPKVYLTQDIVPTLDRILALTAVKTQNFHALECLAQSEFHFVLNNDPSLVPPVIGYLDEVLNFLKLCDATERMRIAVALQEACLNAMYHGNLEVNSSLRQEDETVYHDLIKTRRAQEPFQNRRVYVDVNITPAEATYTIRDEGNGFDPSVLPDPSKPENLEKVGGRGILLIRTFMDLVYHNETGNAITMTKRRVA